MADWTNWREIALHIPGPWTFLTDDYDVDQGRGNLPDAASPAWSDIKWMRTYGSSFPNKKKLSVIRHAENP